MGNTLGNALVRSMRLCVSSRIIPLPFKFIWFTIFGWLLKRRFLRSFRPAITMQCGCRLAGGPTDSNLNKIILFRDVFEPALSDLIRRIVGEGDFCIDAGANAGNFALIMAKKVGASGRVFAIEAAPGNVKLLKNNVDINGFGDRVEVIDAAVTDAPGEVTFYVHPKNDMLCRLELPQKSDIDYWLMGRSWQPVTVRANTLTALVGNAAEKISFIKLDVEGVETKISGEILKSFPHERLCIAIEAKAPHIRETLEPFEKAGFFVYDLHNDYRWVLETKQRPVSREKFADLYKKPMMVDVLLSRKELVLP
jgi:FkbM family methyltransferase